MLMYGSISNDVNTKPAWRIGNSRFSDSLQAICKCREMRKRNVLSEGTARLESGLKRRKSESLSSMDSNWLKFKELPARLARPHSPSIHVHIEDCT